MNTIHSTNRLLNTQNDTHYRDVNVIIDNMNEPNKLDHRCLLKRRNTWPNYLAHNIEHANNYELDKCINFKDLLEIHGFHNIWSEIRQNIERNPKNVKDFRANIAKDTVI